MLAINPQKVIAHLRSKGVSQNELARKIGVTGTLLSKVLNGIQDPSLSTTKRMAEYFGCTIDDLVN